MRCRCTQRRRSSGMRTSCLQSTSQEKVGTACTKQLQLQQQRQPRQQHLCCLHEQGPESVPQTFKEWWQKTLTATLAVVACQRWSLKRVDTVWRRNMSAITGTVQRIGWGNEEKHLAESTRPKPSCIIMSYCTSLWIQFSCHFELYTLHITNLLRLLFWCVCVLLVVLVRFSLRELFVYISCLIAWSRLSVFVAGLVSVHKCVCAPHPCVIPCFRLCVF